MSTPRASLGRILDDLGETLLQLTRGDRAAPQRIGAIVIHDPLDEQPIPPGALVLGIGLADATRIVELIERLGRAHAAGLVLRAPASDLLVVVAAADAAGIAILTLTRGATWEQLTAVLRSVLAEGDLGESDVEFLGGMPAGDLFALANAISALVDAPITIEDRGSHVVAFSGRQDESDPPRIETILGRQVPERYRRLMNERGVFRELYRTTEAVRVDPVPTEDGELSLPRVAVAVRAGDEVLGSIWATVSYDFDDERIESLRDVSKLVALHLLRARAGADVERRVRTDLVSTALEGGSDARGALHRLGLADRPLVVLALAVHDDQGGAPVAGADAVLANEAQQLSSVFSMHLGTAHPSASAALVGNIVYGLLPVSPDDADPESARRIAREFVDRVGDRLRVVVGIGPVAADVSGLVSARLGADRALRVARSGRSDGRVAVLADTQVDALLLELRDAVAARGEGPSGSIARLIAYDTEHRSALIETLRAWLNAFGDVNAAAAATFVHANTFRYRLRRVVEVGGIDLADADARFVAMLQLRVLWPDR